MNLKITLSLLLSAAAFFISIYLLMSRSTDSSVKEEKKETVKVENYEAPKEAPFEIAHYMNRIQVFHNKLYYAGINKNSTLANFYLNELEEEMGAIAEAGVFDVDVNISDNIKTYGLQQVEFLRSQISKGFDTFENDFTALTTSCNSCHVVSKHEYVKIIIPTAPMFTNQEYGVVVNNQD